MVIITAAGMLSSCQQRQYLYESGRIGNAAGGVRHMRGALPKVLRVRQRRSRRRNYCKKVL